MRHQSLDLPGLWKLSYFGKLVNYPYLRSQPKVIRGFMYPLGTDKKNALKHGREMGEPTVRYFPVSELTRLRHGTITEDGTPIVNENDHFSYEIPSVEDINFDEWNVQVLEKSKILSGNRSISDIGNHLGLEAFEEGNSLYLVIGESGNPYRYIIPCTEIFRFFFATSSTLANFAFSDKILHPNTYLWNMEASNLCTKTGSALIWLRKHMLDADARFLARFAWDSFAFERLQEIYLFAAASTGKYVYPRMVYARPPITGVHKTRFYGYESKSIPGSIFVTRLVSCDVPPLFKELKWDRDNDGRSNPDDSTAHPDPKKPKRPGKPIPINKAPELLANEKANNDFSPYRITEDEILERFPALIKTPTEKLPQTVTKKYKATGDVRNLIRESFVGGSVVEGRSSKSLIAPATIAAAELPNDRGNEKANDADPQRGSNDHISILNHLLLASKTGGVIVEFLVVTPETVSYENCPLNVIPIDIERTSKPASWIYVDDKQKCRRCLIVAKVQMESANESSRSKTRYVIEMQPKKSGEFSTIVLWTESDSEVNLSILDGILNDMVDHKQVKVINDFVYGVKWGRLKHTTAYTGIEADTKHFIKRLFDKKAETSLADEKQPE